MRALAVRLQGLDARCATGLSMPSTLSAEPRSVESLAVEGDATEDTPKTQAGGGLGVFATVALPMADGGMAGERPRRARKGIV